MPLRFVLLASLVLTGITTTTSAQDRKAEEFRYYEATLTNGDPAPKPDPWCELETFGERSLWACPRLRSSGQSGPGGGLGAAGGAGSSGDMGGGGGGDMGDDG
jgi:hypothetical protein